MVLAFCRKGNKSMAKPYEKGIAATFKYQAIKYYHFNTQPGTSLLLTANPWSYLAAWYSKKMVASRGPNRARFEKAKYFTEQSESFYEAAEHTKLPTKGTFVYYSMLNLVKAFISVKGIDLEVKIEHHGLSTGQNNDPVLNVTDKSKEAISIFHEFTHALGYPYPHKKTIRLVDIYSQIPEIHEISHTLGHLETEKRGFLPVEIDFLVNESKNKAFVEIRYQKKNESRVPCHKFYKGKFKELFNLRSKDENGWIVYRSKSRKAVTDKNWPIIYRNFCSEIKQLDLCSILTRSGYRYYANLYQGPLPQLPSVLALMFFIGSVARYKPSLTKHLMSGDLYPILAESIESLPRQFLYQMASLITESVCAIPQAKI